MNLKLIYRYISCCGTPSHPQLAALSSPFILGPSSHRKTSLLVPQSYYHAYMTSSFIELSKKTDNEIIEPLLRLVFNPPTVYF